MKRTRDLGNFRPFIFIRCQIIWVSFCPGFIAPFISFYIGLFDFLTFNIISLNTRLGSFMFFPRKILCLGTLFSALPLWRHCIIPNSENMLEKSKPKLAWLAHTVRTPSSITSCLMLKALLNSSPLSSFDWGQTKCSITIPEVTQHSQRSIGPLSRITP